MKTTKKFLVLSLAGLVTLSAMIAVADTPVISPIAEAKQYSYTILDSNTVFDENDELNIVTPLGNTLTFKRAYITSASTGISGKYESLYSYYNITPLQHIVSITVMPYKVYRGYSTIGDLYGYKFTYGFGETLKPSANSTKEYSSDKDFKESYFFPSKNSYYFNFVDGSAKFRSITITFTCA